MDSREIESPAEADYTAAVPLEIDEDTAMRADDLLREFAEDAGLETALIVDRSGALVAGISGEAVTIEVISALVAGASGAMRALVSRLGETGAVESLHLGGNRLVYLKEIVNRFILVAVAEVSRPAGIVRQKALAIDARLDDLLREVRPAEVVPPPSPPARSLRAIARERAALREAGLAAVAPVIDPVASGMFDESDIRVEERDAIQIEEIDLEDFPDELAVEESFETLELDEGIESDDEGIELPVSPFEVFDETAEEADEEDFEPEPEPEPRGILEPLDFGEPEIVIESSPLPPAPVRMTPPIDSPFETEGEDDGEEEEPLITLSPAAVADVFEIEEEDGDEADEEDSILPPPPEPPRSLFEVADDEEGEEEVSEVDEDLGGSPDTTVESLPAPDPSPAAGFPDYEVRRPTSLFDLAVDDDLDDDFDFLPSDGGSASGGLDEDLPPSNLFKIDEEDAGEVDDFLDLDPAPAARPVPPALPEAEAASGQPAEISAPPDESTGEPEKRSADEGEEDEEETGVRSSGPFYF